MGHHLIQIRPQPVPGWVLHWPVCTCGWTGYVLRTQQMAQDQADEHLAEHLPTTSPAQPALFDLQGES
ncbi:hypothetical protein [Nocardiopsis metallicus]|uniref:Uncharacterized protein n=1 Tax=Nocardiopsis metallicus TaxID=179819 RepID=A0A840WS09_9ACTN|nr:hypothetical protein [Nocardiopsis metallicus]MBB5495811.1 hypothetical protein [Nocardiopsis metallicus]